MRFLRTLIIIIIIITRKIKGEINLYIELQEHIKLDQIAARNIRISLDKPIASAK